MSESTARIARHLRTLCRDIGSRHVGSDGEKRAAEYISSEFDDQGYDVVQEAFPVVGWQCESYILRNVSNDQILDVRPCFFSNAGAVEDSLYWITSGRTDSFTADEVRGRLCVVNIATETGKVFGRNAIAERLDMFGATAAIFVSEHYEAINTKIQRSPFLQHLITASISGATLEELSRHPDAQYRLEISAHKFPHQSRNIIARVPGNGPRTVVGAHYDTAPLIEGACDNASGTAALLEVARTLRNSSLGPIDFVAFSAEEYIPTDFPLGSDDYVQRHGEDIRCFLNFDSIGILGGEDQLQVGFSEKLHGTISSALPIVSYTGAGDDKVFHSAGIPTLWVCTNHPFKKIHTSADSLGRLSPQRISDLVIEGAKLVRQIRSADGKAI